VTFGDSTQAATTAFFSQVGAYVLRLTASDGVLSAIDDIGCFPVRIITNADHS